MDDLAADEYAREWFGLTPNTAEGVAFAGWAEDVVDAVRQAAPGSCPGCWLCRP